MINIIKLSFLTKISKFCNKNSKILCNYIYNFNCNSYNLEINRFQHGNHTYNFDLIFKIKFENMNTSKYFSLKFNITNYPHILIQYRWNVQRNYNSCAYQKQHIFLHLWAGEISNGLCSIIYGCVYGMKWAENGMKNYIKSLNGMKWAENGMKNYIKSLRRKKKVWNNGDKIWM